MCYLLERRHFWRVFRVMPDERVPFEGRVGHK